MSDMAILYNATRCTACRGCQVACKQWNENTPDRATPSNWGSYENPPDLSSATWLKIKFTETEKNGRLRWLFTRQSCMHCTDAACVRACPNGTLRHHQSGFVTYDPDTCTGCGYCVDACPFHGPHLAQNKLTGLAKMGKCSFCTTPGYDRILGGGEPACVKTCPTKALVYGNREDMLSLGREQIQALKNEGWDNAYLYGENELGGLHVLYVLDDSPAVYGLPGSPEVSPATVFWKDIVQPAGWILGGFTLAGLVLNYVLAKSNSDSEEKNAKADSRKI